MDLTAIASTISGVTGVSPNNLVGLLSVGAMLINRLPGFDNLSDNFKGGINLSTLTTIFMVATAVWTGSVYIYRKFWEMVNEYYTCSIRISCNTNGTIYRDFHAWLEKMKGPELRGSLKYDLASRYGDVTDANANVLKLHYEISKDADYVFKHKGARIRVSKTVVKVESDYTDEEEVTTLITYGRDNAVLKNLLQDVLDHAEESRRGKTAVHKPGRMDELRGRAGWQLTTNRPKRSIESVVLEDDQKEKILDDITEYLLPQTNKWYANRGLPYRRGYLLYGPPGTGKTSLSMALAGHFGLNLYALSLTHRGLDDESLGDFFEMLPTRCIVLLEDIDASGVRRANDSCASATATAAKAEENAEISGIVKSKTKVTFSGLINAIDGATASEGRILIMTTNHREHLDEALIRPGRVDLQIAFSYASRAVIVELFENLYDVDGDDLVADYIPADFPSRKEVLEMAGRFADLVPEGRFTPAEVQGLLLVYKKDPRKALRAAPGWVERRLRVKEENEKREGAEKASVDSS